MFYLIASHLALIGTRGDHGNWDPEGELDVYTCTYSKYMINQFCMTQKRLLIYSHSLQSERTINALQQSKCVYVATYVSKRQTSVAFRNPYVFFLCKSAQVGNARAKQPSLKSATSEDHTVPVTALLKSATGMAHQTLP